MQRGVLGLVALAAGVAAVALGCPVGPAGEPDPCTRAGFDASTTQVTGTLDTGRTPIDYNNGFGEVSLVHVSSPSDPDSDGCVSQVDIILTTSGQRCRLALTFKAGSDLENLTLATAALDGVECPGFVAEDQVLWQYQGNGVGQLPRTVSIQDDAGVSMMTCTAVSFRPRGIIDVETPGKTPLRLDLGTVRVEGHGQSQADSDAQCVCTGAGC